MPYDPKLGPGNPYLWDEQKQLYYQVGSDGKRSYTNPADSHMMRDRETGVLAPDALPDFNDPRYQNNPQEGGFWHGRGEWDPQQGTYEQPFNYGNLAALGVGGMIAAPFVAGALAGGAGSAAAAPSAAGSSAAAAPATAAVAPAAAGAGTAVVPGVGLTTTGVGPLASGLAGATTSAAAPASLAATTGGSMIPWGEIARYAIPAVTSAFTSNNAANASQQASQQQQDAVRQALALQERIYNQNRSDVQAQMQGLQPYQNAGPGALANLQNLVANPYRGTSQTPQTGYQPQPFQPVQMPQVGGNLMSLGTSVQPMNADRRALGMGMPTGEQAIPRGTAVIQMRGPDGSVRPVLASEEQKWTDLGAQRVS